MYCTALGERKRERDVLDMSTTHTCTTTLLPDAELVRFTSLIFTTGNQKPGATVYCIGCIQYAPSCP